MKDKLEELKQQYRLMFMDDLSGELDGVKWKSLNPTSKVIRLKDVQLRLVQLRKKLNEAYPDQKELDRLLKKPVNRLQFYRRATKIKR